MFRRFQSAGWSPRLWTSILIAIVLVLLGFAGVSLGVNLSGAVARCGAKLAATAPHRVFKCRAIAAFGSADAAKLAVGTFMPLLVGWFILLETAKRKAQDRTLALHQTFSGLMAVRARVFEELASLEGRITPRHPSYADLWTIVSFYESLQVLMDRRFVDHSLATELFGETFVRWHVVHFLGTLDAQQSGVVERLSSLDQRFRRLAPPGQVERWEASAAASMERFRAARATALPSFKPLTAPPRASPGCSGRRPARS
jgi:hypothetical protein